MVRAWDDRDLNLPVVHLVTPEPITEPLDLSDGLGFSWADEWRGGKRSLDEGNGNPNRDAPRKRDLFGGIDPGLLEAQDPTPSKSEGISKDLIFQDAPQRKRDETLQEALDDIIQPGEVVDDPPPDPISPRPRQGWIFSSAPDKRYEASEEFLPKGSTTKKSLLSFKDAPIKRDGGFLTMVKDAMRCIVP